MAGLLLMAVLLGSLASSVNCQDECVDQFGERHVDLGIVLSAGAKMAVQSARFPSRAPGRMVQTWRIEAKEGSIRLNCYTIGLPAVSTLIGGGGDGSCTEYTITIKDGADVQDYCGGIYGMSRLSNSKGFLLTLKTGREEAGLIDCTAQAVQRTGGGVNQDEPTTRRPYPNGPPYLNQFSIEIDSSEHGGPLGRVTTTCPCGTANKRVTKIIGGKETMVNEFPFAVMLVLRGGYGPFCGGSIISEHHVLTAAHCVIKYRQYGISVVAGDHDYSDDHETGARRVVDVREVIMHAEYPDKSHYDIALLVLESPLKYNQFIAPICIPHKQLDLQGQYLSALGWGRTSPYGQGSHFLKKVNVRALSMAICKDYAGVEHTDPHQICTYSKMKGLGKGDSGGPVIWLNKDTNRYTLVGLPSFVYFYNDTNTLPDVSADVSSFLPWIHQKMRSTVPNAQACWATN